MTRFQDLVIFDPQLHQQGRSDHDPAKPRRVRSNVVEVVKTEADAGTRFLRGILREVSIA